LSDLAAELKSYQGSVFLTNEKCGLKFVNRQKREQKILKKNSLRNKETNAMFVAKNCVNKIKLLFIFKLAESCN
jgi:hypothetical protein